MQLRCFSSHGQRSAIVAEVEFDSRYGRLIGCLYLPNGNPRPGPKFDYKLSWIERFLKLSAELVKLDAPVILAGDYNIIPTERDAYKPERWLKDAYFVRYVHPMRS